MLHKVFTILELIAYKKTNTIDAISAAAGIPRSTVHRLLQMLRSEGIVAHKPNLGYVLTPRLLSIGLEGIAERDVLDVAIPFMRHISTVTQETISFSVISGLERICVYVIEGTHPITRNIRVGSRAPLFRGATGKVIASGLTKHEQEYMLERYVADGIFREDELPKLLGDVNAVAQQGYAVSNGELVKGGASVAVSVKDIMNNVVASLSISTLDDRLTPDNFEEFLNLLLDASRQIQETYFVAHRIS